MLLQRGWQKPRNVARKPNTLHPEPSTKAQNIAVAAMRGSRGLNCSLPLHYRLLQATWKPNGNSLGLKASREPLKLRSRPTTSPPPPPPFPHPHSPTPPSPPPTPPFPRSNFAFPKPQVGSQLRVNRAWGFGFCNAGGIQVRV